MPELNDVTALALLAAVIYLAERWLNRMLDNLVKHLDRQSALLAECAKKMTAIQESLSETKKRK